QKIHFLFDTVWTSLTFHLNNLTMITYYSRKIRTSFDAALNKTVENLKLQGFGIITTIDLQEAFKKKLKVNFRNYKILGACNPELAYQGVSLESHVGIMIPCNVVIQE